MAEYTDPNKLETRRFKSYEPEPIKYPPRLTGGAASHRKFLDDTFDLSDDPHASWELKRSHIRNEARAYDPSITDDELERVYEGFNLGQDTNPGDWSREEGFGGALDRWSQLVGNNFGQLKEAASFAINKWTGDTEGMIQDQQEKEEMAFENNMIYQYQTKDMNPVTQFLFDLSVSAPTMVGVMAGGLAAGVASAKLAGALGLGAVAKWIAGALGFNAVEALTEAGFTYSDVISDPMIRKKIEDALGKTMTGADEEAIRIKALEIMGDRAEGGLTEGAGAVALGNFFNPLNTGNLGGFRFGKLIKIASGRWGTIGRAGARGSAREALEEALQSAGSQYYSTEAKELALKDAGAQISFPLREGTIYGIDPKQVGYEALMGGVVGGGISGGLGARSYSQYKAGQFDLDEKGNPVRKGDPKIFAAKNIPQRGEDGFVPRGQIQDEIRRIIDIPDKESSLERLDDFRQRVKLQSETYNNPNLLAAVDEEIESMKQGLDLLGDNANIELKNQRQDRAKDFKPDTHKVKDVETLEQNEDGSKETTIIEGLNDDPVLRQTVQKIENLQEGERTPYEKEYRSIALTNPKLDNKQVRSTKYEVTCATQDATPAPCPRTASSGWRPRSEKQEVGSKK